MSFPLAMFTRAPIAGHTKTRLAEHIGAERAAHLHAAFLRDLVERTRAHFEVTLWVAGALDHPALELGVAKRAQPDGDLGAKMSFAIDHMIANRGAGMIIGSDSPTLPLTLLQRARELAQRGQVLGPSADGGYYLIGGNKSFELREITWSTSKALAQTRANNPKVTLLPPWYDVDDADDLRLLRAHLSVRPSDAAHTSNALNI